MERRAINPWKWQEQFGFNHGHEVSGPGRTLYMAGQGSSDEDGQIIHVGDMGAQVDKTIDNIEAVLSAADMTLADVVRLTIYTVDVDSLLPHFGAFGRFSEAGASFTSSLIGISRLAFPEMLVEVEATAVAG